MNRAECVVAAEMVDHLLSQMHKESFPPVQGSILVAVDNGKNSVDLLLNLLLMALQLGGLGCCSRNVLGYILDVVVLV